MSLQTFDAMEELTKSAVVQAKGALPKIADAKEKEYGIVFSVSGPGTLSSEPWGA